MPLKSTNPATGATIAEYPADSATDIEHKLQQAWTTWGDGAPRPSVSAAPSCSASATCSNSEPTPTPR